MDAQAIIEKIVFSISSSSSGNRQKLGIFVYVSRARREIALYALVCRRREKVKCIIYRKIMTLQRNQAYELVWNIK